MKKNLDTIFNVVLGTAGHIDHGKSSLVRRLTGVDPDRLPEEQSRGLTIDLGFAPLVLRDGKRMGIVDVPGHESLIKNMVAGVTGIDLVLLVVAADDGVMPQTREHLTIMQVLGIQRGLVAVTKIDLVDGELRELVREDIRDTLKGTFLEDAPLVEVSSTTGEGIHELLDALHESLRTITPRETSGIFRMPIQRVFSLKGFGTVVTGIPVSGKTTTGDALEVLPLGHTGRVRGIHAYSDATDMARAGHSSAINITDIDYRDVRRGMVLAAPGFFKAGTMFEAEFLYLPTTRRPLGHQSAIRLHLGTAEVLGRVHLLEGKKLEPGRRTFVQFRLSEPVVAAPGDRYVLRLHSPMETIGGGRILDQSRWRLKTGKNFVLDQLRGKRSSLGDLRKSLEQIVASGGYEVISERDVAVRIGRPLEETRLLIEELVEEGKIQRGSRAGMLLSTLRLREAKEESRRIAKAYYEEHPRLLFMDKAFLRQALRSHEVFLQDLLRALEDAGEVQSQRSGQIRWRDFGPRLSTEDRERRRLIASGLLERPFLPPSPADLAQVHGWDAPQTGEHFELLTEEGTLCKVADGIYFHSEALNDARNRLAEYLKEHGSVTASDAKKLLDSTRKYIIPLLEFFDREGFTVRRGDMRELRG